MLTGSTGGAAQHTGEQIRDAGGQIPVFRHALEKTRTLEGVALCYPSAVSAVFAAACTRAAPSTPHTVHCTRPYSRPQLAVLQLWVRDSRAHEPAGRRLRLWRWRRRRWRRRWQLWWRWRRLWRRQRRLWWRRRQLWWR